MPFVVLTETLFFQPQPCAATHGKLVRLKVFTLPNAFAEQPFVCAAAALCLAHTGSNSLQSNPAYASKNKTELA